MQHSSEPAKAHKTRGAALLAVVAAALSAGLFVGLRGGPSMALVVRVDPAGAFVRLLEPPAGAGPSELVATHGEVRFERLGPSSHARATVSAKGYVQHVVDVMLPARGHEHVVTVKLLRESGLYTVRSEPEGALLYVDGRAAGIAPAVLSDLVPGEHELAAFLEGYQRATLSFDAEAGGRREIVVTLVPLPAAEGAPPPAVVEVPPGYGRVVVESSHAARFFLDNYVLGYGLAVARDVGPGAHRVAASADGRGTKWETVHVREAETSKVVFGFDDDPLEKALEATDPSKPLYWTIRGGNVRNEGRYGDGIEHFKKALELDADDIEAHRQLSRTYPALKRWDEAIAHAERYLELSPAAPDAEFTRELIAKFREMKAAER